MREQSRSLTVTATAPGGRAPQGLDWDRLLRIETPESALQEIACWLDPAASREFVLEFSPRGDRPGAADVRGQPDWRLSVSDSGVGAAPPGLAERAALALEAWRSARLALARADGRLEARTAELDLLQALGRTVADSRTPADLFRGAAEVLHRHEDLDVVMVVHRPAGDPARAIAFLNRTLSASDLQRLARRAGGLLDAPLPAALDVELSRMDAGEEADEEKPRRVLVERDAMVLPLTRGGRAVAGLVLLPMGRVGEAHRRRFYGAANQLSLHLDRILTVQEAERGRFRATLDSMPQAVFLMDRELRVLQANRAAEELRPALGSTDPDGRVDRVGELRIGTLADRVLSGELGIEDAECRTEDGRLWSLTLSSVGPSRQPEGLVLVLADETERRRLQQQLAQSEKMSSLGEMISGIAHELNNPLASIVGFAQLVGGASKDDRLSRRLELLRREAHRCQRIVQNLLAFARRHEPERRPLSLNQVIRSVLALLKYQLRVDDIRVLTELDGDLPSLMGDGHQLQQALVNLITNARHALVERGGGTIRLSTRSAGSRAVIEVADDGPGIPESLRSRIFDPFFSTKDVGQGTGLGLALVFGIVNSHGGRIEVEDAPEGGALFRIELPLGEAKQTEGGEPERPPRRARGTPGSILVIDDEASILELLAETLVPEGHRVAGASDGRQALALLDAEAFDLVICDLRMPGLDGRMLLEQLAHRPPGDSGRLLLTTGDTVSREPEKLAERIGARVLHKPFDLADLLDRVRGLLADQGRV